MAEDGVGAVDGDGDDAVGAKHRLDALVVEPGWVALEHETPGRRVELEVAELAGEQEGDCRTGKQDQPSVSDDPLRDAAHHGHCVSRLQWLGPSESVRAWFPSRAPGRA